jgi:GYF domain 2
MPRWYVQLTGDDPKGPYSTEEIADRVVAGALPPDAPVCPEGDGRYFPLDTLPEFGVAIKDATGRPPRPRSTPPGSRSNPPPSRTSSPPGPEDRQMTTSPKSFRPPPLSSLGHPPMAGEAGISRGRGLLVGAVFANLAAALFWMAMLVYAAWAIATEVETRYGMLLLTIVVAGRIYTTWRLFPAPADVAWWSIGSNVAGLFIMLILVALRHVEAVLVFPIELVAAVLTYLARDLLA